MTVAKRADLTGALEATLQGGSGFTKAVRRAAQRQAPEEQRPDFPGAVTAGAAGAGAACARAVSAERILHSTAV
jgi:hypothetical protein